MTRESDLLHQRAVILTYLKVKILEEDWHGVADAAMDLREIDAELRGLRSRDVLIPSLDE